MSANNQVPPMQNAALSRPTQFRFVRPLVGPNPPMSHAPSMSAAMQPPLSHAAPRRLPNKWSHSPNLAPAATSSLEIDQYDPHKQGTTNQRKRKDPPAAAELERVKKTRNMGACLRCKIKKKQCLLPPDADDGNHCQACTNPWRKRSDNLRVWELECIRGTFLDANIFDYPGDIRLGRERDIANMLAYCDPDAWPSATSISMQHFGSAIVANAGILSTPLKADPRKPPSRGKWKRSQKCIVG
ncbi:Uu.00g135420.m01.CDS01 [Anthostomella pinea]|uniref:Uu.00g135420.m01.CDS01 n=1 Tax=Anthostomella pinea TaxID=933095 RepID=A0AAI8VQB4_9PEZI|nr:Uu.00g135420.m01.CDS01 [Anthostomella pinea]